MDLNAANIHSTGAAMPLKMHKVLGEGSSVLVRVTNNLGGGKYEGFVAGVKVTFSSERMLKAGDSFTAKVSGREGKIILTPQPEKLGMAAENIQLQMSELSSQRLGELLQSSGLSADALTASIFKMFIQTGLKVDLQLMNRIKALSVRFSGRQKSAAELLVMLAEKGIAADEEDLKELFLQLSGEAAWNDREAEESSKNNKEKKLINQLNERAGSWFIIPFELLQYEEAAFLQNNSDKKVLGNGNIRLLFDSGKMLKLMNLDCRYKNKRYLFSLTYSAGKCRGLRFSFDSHIEDENRAIAELKRRFLSAGMAGFEINRAEASDIEGNASSYESVYTFGGEI